MFEAAAPGSDGALGLRSLIGMGDLIGTQENPDAGTLPNAKSEPAAERVEGAEIQENYGEISHHIAPPFLSGRPTADTTPPKPEVDALQCHPAPCLGRCHSDDALPAARRPHGISHTIRHYVSFLTMSGVVCSGPIFSVKISRPWRHSFGALQQSCGDGRVTMNE
jgi:hypothetical protein